jgi:ABC-type glycerol-3-phosphate transport system substrate-binding protein
MTEPPATTSDAAPRRLTRRTFLLASAAAGIAGVATLSACSSSGAELAGTLKVSDGGPYKVLPDKESRAKQPSDDAYAEALQEWLSDNPGVKLEAVNVDVWNKDAMTTAIAGGTAPAIYYANVLGFWDPVLIRQAFAQGLCADVTDLTTEHRLTERLSGSVRPIWEKTWQLDGRYYAAPKTYTVGNGVHYRRDLVAELGLPEPAPGWTWADLRALATGLTSGKRKGIMMQTSPMNTSASECEGMELLGRLPSPGNSWNWSYDYTIHAGQFAQAVHNIRAMRYEDRTAIGDISLGDDPWEPRNAFSRGEVAMHVNSANLLTENPAAQASPPGLAKSLGKPFDEVVGWAVLPAGLNGHGKPSMSGGSIDSVAFSPDLDEDELAAAFSLHMHMIGKGLVTAKKALFENTKDLLLVYGPDALTPVLEEVTADLPGSAEDAWGKQTIASIRQATDIPPQPNEAWYLPVETDPGPGKEALNDAMSRWWYEKANPDVASDLRELTEVRNQQAESFTSSVSDEDFVAGAREYYQAHADYWREHSPDFYRDTFEPWHSEHVRPKLG